MTKTKVDNYEKKKPTNLLASRCQKIRILTYGKIRVPVGKQEGYLGIRLVRGNDVLQGFRQTNLVEGKIIMYRLNYSDKTQEGLHTLIVSVLLILWELKKHDRK